MAWVHSLAWELLHAVGAEKKKKKKVGLQKMTEVDVSYIILSLKAMPRQHVYFFPIWLIKGILLSLFT